MAGRGRVGRVVEQADAPVEALELKVLSEDHSFINVHFAGDPHC
jgi:hypothetical protein